MSELPRLMFGAVPATVLGGLATVGVAVLWMRLFPALREIDELGWSDRSRTRAGFVLGGALLARCIFDTAHDGKPA